MRKEFLLYVNIVSKCLSINIQSVNITEKVGKRFMQFSADSAFSFLGIGSKKKRRNWREVFCNMFYRRLDFPNFKQRQQRFCKAAYLHMPTLQLCQDLFLFEKRKLLFLSITGFFYKKKFYKKMSLKNLKSLRKC